MKVSLPRNEEERQKMAMDKSMNESRMMQQQISAGTDFTDRPQDEGYRPYVSPRDRAIAEGEKDAGKIIENTGPRTKPSKPAIVTKEQLAKSGYDNLRDYLNAKQGLTRRKEKDPTAGDSPDKAAQEAADAIDPGKTMGQPSIMDKSPAERNAMVKLGLQRQEGERAVKEFKAKKAAGYAQGGSVSSASRRADGIATKGKTRGKFV